MKKRIGLIFNHAEIVGGGEISFLDLASALRGSEFEPVAFTPAEGEIKNRLGSLKIETHIFPLPPIRISELAVAGRAWQTNQRLVEKLDLSLLHVNGARAMLYAGMIAHRLKLPCIWHVRVLERDKILDRFRAMLATAIVANSKAVANTLRPCTKKPVQVVYNGLDLAAWQSAPVADLTKLFGIPRHMPAVLAVGRLSRWKGFHDLIAALALLNKSNFAVGCLLVGQTDPADPAYADELKRTIHQTGLTQFCVLTGWRNDIPALMKAATLLVLPSHGEPFGRVIIEAWAAGLPVVATAAGGPAELIRTGRDGLLTAVGQPAALADAIKKIASDTAFAKQLIAGGQHRANEFSITAHADAIKSIYADLIPS